VRPLTDLAAHAAHLRALHHQPELLVLANAWDVPSARAVEAAGFPAVATSSHAVADLLGQPGDDSLDPDVAFAAVARMAAAAAVPVTADIEAGYGLPADELAGGCWRRAPSGATSRTPTTTAPVASVASCLWPSRRSASRR